MTRNLTIRRIAIALTIALPIALAAIVFFNRVDLPYWDEWEWADLVYALHTGTLQFDAIWAQHSEHRMLFPELIMLGLDRFGGWHPVREQFVSLGFVVVSQIAIVALMRRSTHGMRGAIAGLAASFVLYGLWQAENFDWGFQTAWFLCNAAAILVAFFLTRPQRQPLDVFAAIVVAIIGSYSSSQGLLTWLVGIVAITLSFRNRILTLAVWVPVAIVTVLIYRHGMYPVDTGHINVLGNLGTVGQYILTYLGSPFGRWHGSGLSALLGVLSLAALMAFFVQDARSPLRVRRFFRAAPWYALASYVLACSVGTASGRAGFGIDQALAGRYTTISDLLWIALIGLGADRICRGPRLTRRRLGAIALAGVAFVVLGAASTKRGFGEWRNDAGNLTVARDELLHSNAAALSIIYPGRDRVVMLIGKMRDVHDGIFSGR